MLEPRRGKSWGRVHGVRPSTRMACIAWPFKRAAWPHEAHASALRIRTCHPLAQVKHLTGVKKECRRTRGHRREPLG